MVDDVTQRNLLFAVVITMAFLRTLALSWLAGATLVKFRLVFSWCCSSGLALTVFVASAAIYSLSWLIHSLGLLWETSTEVFEMRNIDSWSLTNSLCGLQTITLAAATSGLTCIALAELITGLFRKKWTRQVVKIISIAVYTTVISLAAFLITRLSWPVGYVSLAESNAVDTQNVTLELELLLCGVDSGSRAALLAPAAFLVAGLVSLAAWALLVETSTAKTLPRCSTDLPLPGICCSVKDSPLGRATVAVSSLASLWLASWLLLNALLPNNRSLFSGLALGQHLTLMIATILAATMSPCVAIEEPKEAKDDQLLV